MDSGCDSNTADACDKLKLGASEVGTNSDNLGLGLSFSSILLSLISEFISESPSMYVEVSDWRKSFIWCDVLALSWSYFSDGVTVDDDDNLDDSLFGTVRYGIEHSDVHGSLVDGATDKDVSQLEGISQGVAGSLEHKLSSFDLASMDSNCSSGCLHEFGSVGEGRKSSWSSRTPSIVYSLLFEPRVSSSSSLWEWVGDGGFLGTASESEGVFVVGCGLGKWEGDWPRGTDGGSSSTLEHKEQEVESMSRWPPNSGTWSRLVIKVAIIESSLLSLRLLVNVPAVFLLLEHHLNCLKALWLRGLDLPGLLLLSSFLDCFSFDSFDIFDDLEFVGPTCILGDSGEHPVWASMDVPELESPKVNFEMGPKTVDARGEFCDKDSDGEEGGESEVAAARGDLPFLLAPRGELIKVTVPDAIDEQTIGDMDRGEEFEGEDCADDIAVFW